MRLQTKLSVWLTIALLAAGNAYAEKRDYSFIELTGWSDDYKFTRNWRSYFWTEDCSLRLHEKGTDKTWLVISREPTPWSGYWLSTTYTDLKVDWSKKPTVKIIGVKAVDRAPAQFYGLKLDPENTVTAFIIWVDVDGKGNMKEVYVNNWFHRWSKQTDLSMLKYYADKDKLYNIAGYVTGIAAPFSKDSESIIKELRRTGGDMYAGSIRSTTNNAIGYEVDVTHVMGRDSATHEYRVMYGNPSKLRRLDTKKPAAPKK